MEEISRDDVRFIVLDSTTKPDEAASVINGNYLLVKRFGDFEVFEKSTAD